MSPKHFSNEYRNHPVSYIQQQEKIHRAITSSPAAIVRAATYPARAVISHITQNNDGSRQIKDK